MQHQQVKYFSADRPIPLKRRTQFREFLLQICRLEKQPVSSINYIFCSDKFLLDINQKFLNHNTYTDIITFPLNHSGPIEAEIYISVDRVRENAKSHAQMFHVELSRVMIHGVLHLCGYGDKKKEEKARMRFMEDKYLEAWAKVPRET